MPINLLMKDPRKSARNSTLSATRLSAVFLVLLVLSILALTDTYGNHSARPAGEPLKPTVILISIDAFRADFVSGYQPPNLLNLAREGVQPRWMTPAFPSLTFPNHYTIATGLYPENHGIIGNEMFDPTFNAIFSVSEQKGVRDGRWWGGEPIWVTAEKQGQRAACFFFPGSEAEIAGFRPTYWKPYDEKVPNSVRVDTILSWLDLPAAERPTFYSLYFSDVDTAGHDFSPRSAQVAAAVNRVDQAIGRLVAGLKTRGLFDQVNIIIVSDHGMAPVNPTDVVLLDEYFQTKRAERVVWNGELTHIFPKPGETAEINRELHSGKLAHAQCYLKEKIPARFHYRDNPRIAPIVCMADEGWRIFQRQRFADERDGGRLPRHVIGAHGYDNQLVSMRATFIGHGPAFRSGAIAEPIESVDVYGIMAEILHLTPAKNAGHTQAIRNLLRQ